MGRPVFVTGTGISYDTPAALTTSRSSRPQMSASPCPLPCGGWLLCTATPTTTIHAKCQAGGRAIFAASRQPPCYGMPRVGPGILDGGSVLGQGLAVLLPHFVGRLRREQGLHPRDRLLRVPLVPDCSDLELLVAIGVLLKPQYTYGR